MNLTYFEGSHFMSELHEAKRYIGPYVQDKISADLQVILAEVVFRRVGRVSDMADSIGPRDHIAFFKWSPQPRHSCFFNQMIIPPFYRGQAEAVLN